MANRTATRYKQQLLRCEVERDEAKRETARLQNALRASESRHAADSETWANERADFLESFRLAEIGLAEERNSTAAAHHDALSEIESLKTHLKACESERAELETTVAQAEQNLVAGGTVPPDASGEPEVSR